MRKLASIAVVFAGLIVLSQVPALIGYIIVGVQLAMSGEILPGLLTPLPLLAALALAFVLVRNREALAARWFSDEPLSTAVDPETLLRAGIIAVGLWIAATSAVSFVESLVVVFQRAAEARMYLAQEAATNGAEGEMFITTFGNVWLNLTEGIPALAGMLIGALLIRGSSGLAERFSAQGERIAPAAAVAVEQTAAACPACGLQYDPADYVGGGAVGRCTSCGCELEL